MNLLYGKRQGGLSELTQKSIRKRSRLAHGICKINNIEGYVEKLETSLKYKKLDDGVESNEKYAESNHFKCFEP